MKVKIQQFLFGKNHSWAVVGQNIGRAFLKKGYHVDFISTDGIDKKFVPRDLEPHIKLAPDGKYDLQVSYTMPHNFPLFLQNGTKNRFGIWCYEFTPHIPPELIKFHSDANLLLAPSDFARDMFVGAKYPKDKVCTIPHGVNISDFESQNVYPLKTKKSFKFLMVIGQPHKRKRIGDAIEAFYKAFTREDDVCLVAKISKPASNKLIPFEENVGKIIDDLNKKYKNHPEMELITSYVPSILDLHRACQVVYTLTYSECFYIPGLDGLFANNLVIAPRYGGQLDFCNDSNSLLIDGKMVRAPLEMQYHTPTIQNSVFAADMDDAVKTLQRAYKEREELMNTLTYQNKSKQELQKFTWDNIATEIEAKCS